MVWQAMEHPDFEQRDLSSLRNVAYGGAPAAPELVRAIEEQFPGRSPSNGYGLTETSSVTTMNAGVDYVRHPESVGVHVPVCEVKVVDEDGRALPTGEIGELWIKGPNVVRGYWNRPEETAQVISADGYFRTGDIGVMSADGYIKIVDRKKDMILVSGFNVYPNEIEEVIASHPGVLECAVIGVPDEKSGEAVKAFVVKKDPNVTAEDIVKFCRDQLTAYKVPRHVEFRTSLPKTNVGKILRRQLRDEKTAAAA